MAGRIKWKGPVYGKVPFMPDWSLLRLRVGKLKKSPPDSKSLSPRDSDLRPKYSMVQSSAGGFLRFQQKVGGTTTAWTSRKS